MCGLQNMKKSLLAEPSQCKKRALKKTNVGIDEWAALEWTCVDSPTNTVDEY